MQKNKTIFDVIGPIIIGPSSSHTAGAVRIGYLAGKIFKEKPKKITFKLYNSFAKTGRGHGTPKALLGGVLGYRADSTAIKNAFELARCAGIEYSFEFLEDFARHPNCVDIILENSENSKISDNMVMEISGSSLGAGDIAITSINGYKFNINGNYPTLLLIYKDKPGMIYRVSVIIQEKNVNIASMSCERKGKGEEACMAIYLDSKLDDKTVEELKKIDEIYFVRSLDTIK